MDTDTVIAVVGSASAHDSAFSPKTKIDDDCDAARRDPADRWNVDLTIHIFEESQNVFLRSVCCCGVA